MGATTTGLASVWRPIQSFDDCAVGEYFDTLPRWWVVATRERAILHAHVPGQKAIWSFFAQLAGVSKKCYKRRRKSGYFANLLILLDRFPLLVQTPSSKHIEMRISLKNAAGR